MTSEENSKEPQKETATTSISGPAKVAMAGHSEIESANDHINNVIKNMIDFLIVTDLNGKINTANEAALNLLGYNRDELLNMNLENIISDEFKKESKTLIAKDQLTNYEASLRSKSGQDIPVLLSGSVMRDKEANVTAIVYTAKDITECRKAQQQLQSVSQELKKFAYVVSHDLKAPLRGISTLAEWISTDYTDKLDDEGKENLKLLIERVDRIQNLIDGVLQYSRIGRIEDEKVAVDLNKLVPEIIDSIAPPENITITVENQLPEIECSRARILQVFQNLLSNAVKYIDKPQGLIKIGCVEENNFWKFNITDNGCGIGEENLERIFQLFQIVKPVNGSESIGVGLTLVKKIIELYEGKIWVQSKIDEGTTFFFTLPIQKTAAETKELVACTVG